MSNKKTINDLKNQIKTINKKLKSAVKFPQSNPHYVVQVSSKGEILFANEASKSSIFSKLDRLRDRSKIIEFLKTMKAALEGDGRSLSKTLMFEGSVYNTTFVPFKEEDYVIIYGVDITESQKEIENLARFPEENPHSVIRVDKEGTVIFANAPAKNQILLELESDVGQKVPNILQKTIDECLENDSYVDVNHNLGERIYACTFVPIKTHSYVNIYGIDITEKINAQNEAEQTNQELIQAEKMASLGVVISGIAHEIRNPLQVIMALSESIVDDDDLPRIQNDAHEIVEASKRISEIVNDLSTHARDARTTGNSSINLNDIANKSMEISKHTRNLTSINVIKEFANEAIILGSSSELTQVITNFVNNAVDAMEGEGKLWLITTASENECSISVKDNGSGMDQETQKKIFDPFFTTKEPGKGTGLGLHVVRKIIEKHDAKLELDSKLNEGTTFTIKFSTLKNKK
jgi:signal transduction histidine kinase